ncbi:sulfurtransferase [Halalkalibacter kiskunsagensis]|uniref:Sulfurtransferase n=1 Tax=Halalkalibacter kiskunsagensis TaxID=1548599 RepID=A0ABV6KK72_9BACI
MDDIVKVEWLQKELKKSEHNYVIIDVRFQLANPEAGKQVYKEAHIPEAVYIDLENDLSSAVREHGGRHPLPDLNEFAEKLGRIGIGKDTNVIVYDDQGGMVASRLWWLLKHLGHSNVAILDGGFSKWVSKGYEVTKNIPVNTSKTFLVQISDEWAYVNANQVKERLNHPDTVLIDSRESNRYFGWEEPIDTIAGHIPGAVNYFWKNVLNENGLWKDNEELKENFSEVLHSKEIIVYCGSGVSACPNVLALKKAGYSNVKLYAGSWSDWITHEDFPIARK